MTSANPIQNTASNPLISICIPTYNQANFIAETLHSCLAQTYSNIEVVVVDDCSSDGTIAVAQEVAKAHPSIRIIRNECNVGIEKNWNIALSSARGDFIKILCGDDLISPNCIQLQYAAFLCHPELSLVSSNRAVIDRHSQVVLSAKRSHFLSPTRLENGLDVAVRSGTNIIGEPACVLFRKGSATFDSEFPYMIDLDLWFKLWERGPILVLNERLASFRIHPSSLTSAIGLRHFQEYLRFLSKVRKRHPELIRVTDQWIGSVKAFFLSLARNLFLFLNRY